MYISFKTLVILIIISGIGLSQNSWEFSGGPYYGAAEVMATNSNGHIFAGTSTGLYRSTDDGNTWLYVTESIGIIDVRAVATKSSVIVFIGTNDGGLYRSINNGDSWILVYQSIPPMNITSLVCRNTGDVFAGIDSSGIFCSTNDGDTWLSKNQGLTNTCIQVLAAKPNGDLYAGTLRGLFYSSDNGDNWDTLNAVSDAQINKIAFNSNGDIFRISGINLFRSTDEGITWKNLSVDTIKIPIHIVKQKFTSTTIAIDTNDNIVVNDFKPELWQYRILIRSSDNGDNWVTVLKQYPPITNYDFLSSYYPPTHDTLNIGWVGSLIFSPNGDLFIGTEIGGVIRFAENDTNWTVVNRNLASPYISSMVLNNSAKVFLMTEKGVWRSSEGGGSWTRINENLLNSHSSGIACSPNGNLYVAHEYNWRSTDAGDHWDTCDSSIRYQFVVAASPNGNVFTGNPMALSYKSTDGGVVWSRLYNGSNPLPFDFIAISPNEHIYISLNPLARSTDDGENWIECGNGLPSLPSHFFSFDKNGNGYAAVEYYGLYRSTNNGDDWELKNDGLPLSIRERQNNPVTRRWEIIYYPPRIRSVAFNKNGAAFVGYDRGVYYSTNDGDTWLEFNRGLPLNTTINALAIDSSGYLYAGLDNGTVFKTTQITTSVTEQPKNNPTKFSLAQNYPNPFNPNTVISYQLSAISKVRLKVYDILGREVVTLVNTIEGGGTHYFTWNAKVATGVYFYRLEAASVKDPSKRFTDTKKMVVLR